MNLCSRFLSRGVVAPIVSNRTYVRTFSVGSRKSYRQSPRAGAIVNGYLLATVLICLPVFPISVHAQVDNCPWISGSDQTDTDGDGVGDVCDNCINAENGPARPDVGGNSQFDSDADGYGNMCDPDFNNDGLVDFADMPTFQAAMFSEKGAAEYNPVADINGDGIVSFDDMAIFQAMFFGAPGPTALKPNGDNAEPVADAGPAQTVAATSTVTLDGTGSIDPDGDKLVYSWTPVETPVGSAVALSDPLAPRPDFVPDVPGVYAFSLTVADGTAVSSDVVTVSATGNTAVDSQALLRWRAPTQNEDGSPLRDLAGFRIYYGQSSPSDCLSYPNVKDVNDAEAESAVVDNLDVGKWYFSATAYDTSGNQSRCSTHVNKTIQ